MWIRALVWLPRFPRATSAPSVACFLHRFLEPRPLRFLYSHVWTGDERWLERGFVRRQSWDVGWLGLV